ncbi:MAG: hypothetical protein JXB32_10545 [Deltaproteobacteria bacterium]|nr:hypothetical protein [Deltaproteobacteria bacterium]
MFPRCCPLLVASLALGAASTAGCRKEHAEPPREAEPFAVPAAEPPAGDVERVLAESRARQEAQGSVPELELLVRRFRRMNLVAMGRNPESGTSLHTTKNEAPGFRQLARVLRAQLGDDAVDVLGERLADRALAVLIDEAGTFRVPIRAETFQGERLAEATVEVLGWTRDLPLLLLHYGLVTDDNRTVLPRFTLRTLLRARWNLETERPPEHGLSEPERIAWLEFRGRYRRHAPLQQRRQALVELARLLPSYPLERALGALVREARPATGAIREEGAPLP